MPCGGVWPCGRRWSWVLPVARDPRTGSEVRSGLGSLLLPLTVKQRIRDTSSAQRTVAASWQRQQGPGTIPSTQQSSYLCWEAALRSGHRVWCWSPAPPLRPPQHRSPPGLAKWGSCRRQGCLITEQPWKPATAAALWPGGEAAGL